MTLRYGGVWWRVLHLMERSLNALMRAQMRLHDLMFNHLDAAYEAHLRDDDPRSS